MTQRNSHFTIFLIPLFFCFGIFGQDLSLKIASKDSVENTVLKNLKYTAKHSSEEKIISEIESVSNLLKEAGYFYNYIESNIIENKNYTYYFSLGKKVEKAFINIKNIDFSVKGFDTKKDSLQIPIEKLTFFLTAISSELDKQGKSFSEVKLKNIILKKNTLFADLYIKESKKRKINSVIVKGYDGFSKSYIKHYLNINKQTIFNQKKLKDISEAIESLDFVSEIKPPEVLFSKDSTLLYIYLKKNKINNFDGLLNFASKENGGGILFNGHLDLKLNNVLNTGEQFQLFWKANGEERQEFTLSTTIPYIFSTAFSTDLSFKIYRQDSTFLNTKFTSEINYTLNSKSSVGLTYNSETSENTLQNNTSLNVKDFENSFLGIQYNYNISNNDNFFNDKFSISINPSFGNRASEGIKTNQFKIDFEASYLWEFNYRNSIYIRNKTGYLNSNNFIENELYRIGGAKSIRGFNEQSIFTSQYSFINLEYRYLTSENSYLYSITDFGNVKDINSNLQNLYGFGVGYLFKINNSQVNLGFVLGKNPTQNFDFESSKLILSFVSFF